MKWNLLEPHYYSSLLSDTCTALAETISKAAHYTAPLDSPTKTINQVRGRKLLYGFDGVNRKIENIVGYNFKLHTHWLNT
jgi:hypothetical protein